MDPNTLVALTVGAGASASLIGTILAPMVLMYLTAHEKRREREEDWARQDLVAERLAQSSANLLKKTEAVAKEARTTASLLLEANERVAAQSHAILASSEKLEKKVDVVHGLVNSALTTVKQSEYDGLVRELYLKQQNIILERGAGTEPTKASLDYVELLTAKISDLKNELEERGKAMLMMSRQHEEVAAEAALDIRRRGEDLGK